MSAPIRQCLDGVRPDVLTEAAGDVRKDRQQGDVGQKNSLST
jgi:hypothetical protein